MRAFWDTLKIIKPWQAGLLMAVLVGAAGATFGIYMAVAGTGGSGLNENQQLIPVQRGNLTNQVSVSGSLIFPGRETLTFDAQGTIGEVLVEEGQQVTEGQELAKLDETTVASLAQAVAQARIDLQNAEDDLGKAKDPHSNLDFIQAEAKVANARLALQSARDDLADLMAPTPQDIAQAEANVANAKLSLQNARDALSMISESTAQDLAQAETTVTSAKISVQNAREALDDVKGGPSDENIATSQSQVDFAGTALANAVRDLSLARKEWDTKLGSAEDVLSTALEGYQKTFQKWLGVDAAEVDESLDPDAIMDSLGVDLYALFDPDTRFVDFNKGSLAEGPPPDDLATPWSEVVVYVWMNWAPGNLLPTCEDIVITLGTQCVKKEMDDGWDAVVSAADNLNTVETQAAKAISNAEAAVAKAEEQLTSAQTALADLEAGPDPLEIEFREKELALVEASSEDASAKLAELLAGSDPVELEAEEKQVAVALANLDQAQEDLVPLNAGPDPLVVEAQRKQVTVAQANLEEAEEELDELRSSVDVLDVTLRASQVISAQLAMDTAIQRLGAAVLWAPMAGGISVANLETGQTINANTPVIEIVDPTIVEVDGIVDEIDVLFVRDGARAQVTMDALPGRVLEGTVSTIASAAQNQQGVVSYPIGIQVQLPGDTRLVEGLSATASIVLREETDVLLVPLQAVYGTFDQPLLRVMSNGTVNERAVSLGNSDDFWVVVLEGVREREQVALETTEASDDPFAQIRQRIQAGGGGGFGGGGGGFPGGGERRPGN